MKIANIMYAQASAINAQTEAENAQLVEAYHSIALVWVQRASRKGSRATYAQCPYAVHEAMRNYLEADGFTVSEWGKNFDGESTHRNAYLIAW